MNDETEETLVEKKPSIKLVKVAGLGSPVYKVKTMVDCFKYDIGDCLTKEQVQKLVDDGSVKVTIN